MNTVSLTFKDSNFENQYRHIQHIGEFSILRKNFLLLCLIGVLLIISNMVRQNYVSAILEAILILILTVIMKCAQNRFQVLNYSIFFFQIILNVIVPVSIYLNNNINEQQYIFCLGQGVAYLSFSLLLGTQFLLKASVCIINCLVQSILIWMKSMEYTIVGKYFFIFETLMVINYLYMAEKEKRKRFLLEIQKNQFDSLFQSQINIGLVECKFIKNRNNSFLQKANKYAENVFNIYDENGFKKFIRKIFVSPKFLSHSQSMLSAKSQIPKIKLEQFIYDLFTNPLKYQRFQQKSNSICDQKYLLEGLYEYSLYSIKLSLFYCDDPYILIVLEKQSTRTSFIRTNHKLQLAQKMINQLCQSQQGILKNIIRSLLSQPQLINFEMKYSEEAKFFSYLAYHNLLNFYFYTNGIQKQQNPSKINIRTLIRELILTLKPFINYKKIKIKLRINEEIIIFSYSGLIQQLLMNLLMNSLKYNFRKSIIIITITKNQLTLLPHEIYSFTIQDEGQLITKEILSKLPIINPQIIKNFQKMNDLKKLKFGFAVSSMILKYVGPYDYLIIHREQFKKKISFDIFKDIRNQSNCMHGKDISMMKKIKIDCQNKQQFQEREINNHFVDNQT